MPDYPEPLARLINELQKLPTIGPKTAQRLAFYMLKMPDGETAKLAQAISEMKTRLFHCTICGNITDKDPCRICTDPTRDHKIICVVEEADDLLAIERTKRYKWVYHVLMGVISPLDGVGPDDLRINSLSERINNMSTKEVVLATNHTTQGQATALYLARLLKRPEIIITRIQSGIPVGGDLEYIDEVTLTRALEARQKME
ncbi:recombination protein RecR [Candidatus Poribacteria bacterium]|nr:recombination protein RecR [Candidatus Poribacteria bacterium]